MTDQPHGMPPGGAQYPSGGWQQQVPHQQVPQQPYPGQSGPWNGQYGGPGIPGGPMAYPPPPMDSMPPQDKGFFESLFDYSFTSFVTPRLIKAIYILMTVVIACVWVGAVVVGFVVAPVLGLLYLVVGAFVALLWLALYRVGLEMIMVIFRIGDNVQAIASRDG